MLFSKRFQSHGRNELLRTTTLKNCGDGKHDRCFYDFYAIRTQQFMCLCLRHAYIAAQFDDTQNNADSKRVFTSSAADSKVHAAR